MIQIFYFSLFIVYANSQTQNDTININSIECGGRNRNLMLLPNKIVGGNIASPEDWGWQVAMFFNGRFTCGGSLINSQWVITAGHCVYSRNIPDFFSFYIGLHDRLSPEKGSIKRKVTKIILNQNFDQNFLYNDIALMKLDKPIEYSNQILPICIPNNTSDFSRKESWATGWGTLISGGLVSRYLMEVQMPVLTDAECSEKFKNYVNTSLEICSGESGKNKDTCQGDSGGPLVVRLNDRWELAGITSWGYGCGNGGVYTRTSYYYDWIIEQIRKN